MEKYWLNRPRSVVPAQATISATQPAVHVSDFDRHRQILLMDEEEGESWAAELRRYLKEMPADVSKETDIVEWWQVCHISLNYYETRTNVHK